MDTTDQIRELISNLVKQVQPKGNLKKNFDIDLSKQLEEYFKLVDVRDSENSENEIGLDHGLVNFPQAALMIQNSSLVYDKKVEYLYKFACESLSKKIDKKVKDRVVIDHDQMTVAQFADLDPNELFQSFEDTDDLDLTQFQPDPSNQLLLPKLPYLLLAKEIERSIYLHFPYVKDNLGMEIGPRDRFLMNELALDVINTSDLTQNTSVMDSSIEMLRRGDMIENIPLNDDSSLNNIFLSPKQNQTMLSPPPNMSPEPQSFGFELPFEPATADEQGLADLLKTLEPMNLNDVVDVHEPIMELENDPELVKRLDIEEKKLSRPKSSYYNSGRSKYYQSNKKNMDNIKSIKRPSPFDPPVNDQGLVHNNLMDHPSKKIMDDLYIDHLSQVHVARIDDVLEPQFMPNEDAMADQGWDNFNDGDDVMDDELHREEEDGDDDDRVGGDNMLINEYLSRAKKLELKLETNLSRKVKKWEDRIKPKLLNEAPFKLKEATVHVMEAVHNDEIPLLVVDDVKANILTFMAVLKLVNDGTLDISNHQPLDISQSDFVADTIYIKLNDQSPIDTSISS